jgi:hypothetical protein
VAALIVLRTCSIRTEHLVRCIALRHGASRATDYEILEGARGSKAVRQSNCQHAASPNGPAEALESVAGVSDISSRWPELTSRGGDPSALDSLPRRRLNRRAAESKWHASSRTPCSPWSTIEVDDRSSAKIPRSAWSSRLCPDATSHRAGSSIASMALPKSNGFSILLIRAGSVERDEMLTAEDRPVLPSASGRG